MFESDDFDQILSQFDLSDVSSTTIEQKNTKSNVCDKEAPHKSNNILTITEEDKCIHSDREDNIQSVTTKILNSNDTLKFDKPVSPKHKKRKIIKSIFNNNNKRKFPGPAGLLAGSLEETKDENISHMELLSQDIQDLSHNNLRTDLFELSLWHRLLGDLKDWNLGDIDSIKAIKYQALAGNLRRRKAQIVTAFVEIIDRSATDPLIILRDKSGNIKCTLHRDAWSTFSSYIASEYCALVLWKPTVLTTGSTFKKHYLNITLSNIYAIYSSAILDDEIDGKQLPDSFIRICEEELTIIKTQNLEHLGTFISQNIMASDANDMLDGLDKIFSDEIF